MALKESGEMYLETLYVLSKKLGTVRAIDVCDYMGYSKPSVSRAMGLLKQGEYITIDNNGHITLTPIGFEIATKLYERHTILSEVLVSLGVGKEVATEDACRIEHVISEDTFNAIKLYLESIK